MRDMYYVQSVEPCWSCKEAVSGPFDSFTEHWYSARGRGAWVPDLRSASAMTLEKALRIAHEATSEAESIGLVGVKVSLIAAD
jgi:hypothetical protein